jgi:hypothetical protein
MATNLGVKYTCFKCGAKFYDLKRPIPLCPKCGADQRESPPPEQPVVERKRARSKTPPEVEALPADSEASSIPDDAEEEEPEADVAAESFDEEP